MNPFQSARIKLTAWYILIIIVLLALCNLAAISAEQKAFGSILQALGDPVQRPNLTTLLERRIFTFEANFRHILFLFDIVMVLLASLASYFLSGLTLGPIAKMLKQQEEFAADASHELRTPLTTIGVSIEAFKRTEKDIPKKYQTILDDIEEEAKRMKGMVDGLLTIVRDDNQKSESEVFNLNKIAQDVIHQMESLAKDKEIELKLEDLDQIKILGNPNQIKELLIILIDNAIKFTPNQKSIQISLFKGKNDLPTLIVSDQGVGIQKSDLPHIFERFYQGYHSEMSSKASKGAGLGLSIAKKIVDTNKGKISVESTINEGTKFTISFPKAS